MNRTMAVCMGILTVCFLGFAVGSAYNPATRPSALICLILAAVFGLIGLEFERRWKDEQVRYGVPLHLMRYRRH